MLILPVCSISIELFSPPPPCSLPLLSFSFAYIPAFPLSHSTCVFHKATWLCF